jgi:hypothetical protein
MENSTMKKFIVLLSLLSGSCGPKNLASQKVAAVAKTNSPSNAALLGSSYQIECTASKYQNAGWTELAKFKSKNEPVSNNGESSQNAEFTSDDGVGFSASGNFDEGLMYFGSIYDFNRREGTQIQLAKKQSLDLYLLQGAFGDTVQHSLHCDMIKN